VTDTSEATLQADRLGATGVAEPSECGSATLGRTVWLKFFPDVDGRIELQAVGFDATLALVPFTSVAVPSPQGYTCANQRDDTIERLDEPVTAGTGYAVQAGGAGGAAGPLQIGFTFRPDRDGDGVTDEEDHCPRKPGTANGCPPRIVAGIHYKYDGLRDGVRFRYLEVREAPAGAHIDVRCSRGCSHQRLTVRSAVTRIKAFRGRFVASGATVEVRVTHAGSIGSYRKFTISSGDARTTDRCLQPGSTVPKRSCR
jgi:hypothetical protein